VTTRTPLLRVQDAEISGGDLPDGTRKIFFARGLDDPNQLEQAHEIRVSAHAILRSRTGSRTARWSNSGSECSPISARYLRPRTGDMIFNHVRSKLVVVVLRAGPFANTLPARQAGRLADRRSTRPGVPRRPGLVTYPPPHGAGNGAKRFNQG